LVTYRLSLGANYRYSDAVLLRGGIAFDQSPVRSAQLTDPAFPDSSRVWYSLGLNYRFDKHSSIDAAYSYVTFKDAPVDYTSGCTPLSQPAPATAKRLTASTRPISSLSVLRTTTNSDGIAT